MPKCSMKFKTCESKDGIDCTYKDSCFYKIFSSEEIDKIIDKTTTLSKIEHIEFVFDINKKFWDLV